MRSVSDAALIRACVDRPAEFSRLYERHLPAVAGYLTRVGGVRHTFDPAYGVYAVQGGKLYH
jgi:hypothetical protein